MKGVKILAGRILVKPPVKEEQTVGGIIIPGNIDKKPNSGTVVVVGKGLVDVEMEIAVGDNVVFNEGAGMVVKIGKDEEEYLLMEQRHVNYWTRP